MVIEVLAFSLEEFHTMTEELLVYEPASFDMLCHIARKTLQPTVRRWCNAESAVAGREFEEDLMQEICIRLIKTCVTSFLLRDGPEGPVNRDPEGFQKWMFTVAKNLKRDLFNEVRKVAFHTCGMTSLPEDTQAEEVPNLDALRLERLSVAFEIVLDADVQVYKTLTWMAQCLFVLEFDITKIQSNEKILETFADQTVGQMRDAVFTAARRYPWIRITPQQAGRIDRALAAPFDEDRPVGAVPYREFFMKKGGKATISDWVNRMNSIIKRVTKDEASNS